MHWAGVRAYPTGMNRLVPLTVAAVLSWSVAVPAGAQTRSLFDQPEAQDVPKVQDAPQVPVPQVQAPQVQSAPAEQARPDAKREPRSVAVQQQDEFIQRIQRSDKRATASICANGCRGEIGGRIQKRDPFAPLPDYDRDEVPSGYSVDP